MENFIDGLVLIRQIIFLETQKLYNVRYTFDPINFYYKFQAIFKDRCYYVYVKGEEFDKRTSQELFSLIADRFVEQIKND